VVRDLILPAPRGRSRVSEAEFFHDQLEQLGLRVGVDLVAQVGPALGLRLPDLAPEVTPGGRVLSSGCLGPRLSGVLQATLVCPSELQAASTELTDLGGPLKTGHFLGGPGLLFGIDASQAPSKCLSRHLAEASALSVPAGPVVVSGRPLPKYRHSASASRCLTDQPRCGSLGGDRPACASCSWLELKMM